MTDRTEPETMEESRRRRLLKQALACVVSEEEAETVCGELLSAFGGFDGIFAAPEEVLREACGSSPKAVGFLRLVTEIALAYLEERSWNMQRVYDTASAVELFRPKFLDRKSESLCLMMLDGRGRAIYNEIVCEGSVSQVPLYLSQVLRLCIEYQTTNVFVAHNHPSGLALPSQGDLVATDRLLTALDSIEVTLNDHIIFAGESYFSLAESGLLKRQRQLMQEAQAREINDVRGLGQHYRED